MIRGTTPPIIITLPDTIPVSDIAVAYVSFEQFGQKIVEKDIDDMTKDTETNSLVMQMTQEETLKFKEWRAAPMEFQLRFLMDGDAYATEKWKEPIEDVIKEGEI